MFYHVLPYVSFTYSICIRLMKTVPLSKSHTELIGFHLFDNSAFVLLKKEIIKTKMVNVLLYFFINLKPSLNQLVNCQKINLQLQCEIAFALFSITVD